MPLSRGGRGGEAAAAEDDDDDYTGEDIWADDDDAQPGASSAAAIHAVPHPPLSAADRRHNEIVRSYVYRRDVGKLIELFLPGKDHIDGLTDIIVSTNNGQWLLDSSFDVPNAMAAFVTEMLPYQGTTWKRLTGYCYLTFRMLCNDEMDDTQKANLVNVLLNMARTEFDLLWDGDNPSRGVNNTFIELEWHDKLLEMIKVETVGQPAPSRPIQLLTPYEMAVTYLSKGKVN